MAALLQPWPDRGRPEDIAGTVVWLASEDSRFVTREAIRVHGGLVAAGTHISAGVDQHGTCRRYAGFAHGTTGRPGERRRLDS